MYIHNKYDLVVVSGKHFTTTAYNCIQWKWNSSKYISSKIFVKTQSHTNEINKIIDSYILKHHASFLKCNNCLSSPLHCNTYIFYVDDCMIINSRHNVLLLLSKTTKRTRHLANELETYELIYIALQNTGLNLQC